MMPKSFCAVSVVAIVLASGCGSKAVDNSPEVFENNALSEIGEVYRGYTMVNKKPPQSIKDFEMYRDGNPTGVGAAAKGELIVLWGAKLTDLSDEGANDSPDEVLAYVKEAPEQGGLVLMKNRKIKKMTAEEFKAAPKAGTVGAKAKS